MKVETENSGFHLATFFVKENKFLLKLIKMDLERFGTKLYVCVCVCVCVCFAILVRTRCPHKDSKAWYFWLCEDIWPVLTREINYKKY